MKLYNLRVRIVHHYAYQPDSCNEATATGIYWDTEHRRIAVELTYDNGAIDWVPLDDLNREGYYEVTNK